MSRPQEIDRQLIQLAREGDDSAIEQIITDLRAQRAEVARLTQALQKVACVHHWLPPTEAGGNDVCEKCGAVGGRWVR